MAGDPALDPDRRRWLSGLEPVQRLIGGWRYRCRHFFRDAEGLGVCGIHATRPSVCRDFPYGGVVRGWTECVWHVQIVDAEGNRLDRLPVVR
jgi:Fe-S-cluster containining protein